MLRTLELELGKHWRGCVTDATPKSIQPLDASVLERSLRILERELERSAVTRPPSDEALDRWQSQASHYAEILESASLPGRHRLLRHCQRFLGELQDMRERKARYLAKREPVPRIDSFSNDTSAWFEAPSEIRRQLLAASVHKQLRDASGFERGSQAPRLAASILKHPSADEEETTASDGEMHAELLDVREVDLDFATQAPSAQPTKEVVEPSSPREVAVAAPVRLAPRLSRRVDPIMAIEGRLARPGTFEEARAIALEWLRKKGFSLPYEPEANFDLRTPKGHTAKAVSEPERGLWALQAETTDQSLKGRRWRVEMVVLDASPTPAVSVTLTAISPADTPEPQTSIPGLVIRLMQGIGLLDAHEGETFNAGPTWIRDPVSLQRLLRSLTSLRRTRPIVVISTYLKDGNLKQLLDPAGLSQKLGGLAQVFVLDRDMAWPFAEAVGRKAAVAGASIRLFRLGFTPEDEPGRHPLWSPTELTAQGLNLWGLSNALLREAAYQSLRALEREDAIPAFEQVRELVLRRQIEEARRQAKQTSYGLNDRQEVISLRKELETEVKLKDLYEEDNDSLRTDIERIRMERNALRDDRDTLRSRLMYLESRVQELQVRLRDSQGVIEPDFPSNWDDLEGWCEEYLEGRVILTRKALKAAQDSLFHDIQFVYRVLWFLAERYVPARRDGGEDYKDELAALRLEISPVGRAAIERRNRDTYSTQYKHERVALDWHVKGNSDRDPRYGLRIYFHWHDGDRCVVVGWLPQHLANALS